MSSLLHGSVHAHPKSLLSPSVPKRLSTHHCKVFLVSHHGNKQWHGTLLKADMLTHIPGLSAQVLTVESRAV